MDLVTFLPHDDILFPCVFSHLSVEDLFRLRQVSHSFRDAVEQYFTRCTNLDLSKTIKKGNADAFRLMTDENTVLQRLCLSGATHWLTDELLLPVITSCSLLCDIDLSLCSQLTNNVLYSLAMNCRSLTSVSLRGCHWVDQENFQLLIASNTSLLTLDVTSCWSLNDDCICFCAQSCRGLKTLKLTNLYAITNQSLTTIAKSCPNLNTLAVNGCWRISNDGIRTIGEYCSKLRSLSVNDCRDVTEASLARLRVRGIAIDIQASPSGALQRLENAFRHTRPHINLQI